MNSLPPEVSGKIREIKTAIIDTGKALKEVEVALNTSEGRQLIPKFGSGLDATVGATVAAAPSGVGAVVEGELIGSQAGDSGMPVADTVQAGQ